MSKIEHPIPTTLRFIEGWRTQNTERVTQEIISLHNETKRIPDVYYFEVGKNCLIDPITKRPIFDFIAKGVEWEIAEKLQNWALNCEEGVAFWISPKLEGIYPCNKIIIHTIAYTFEGKKVVLNSAILFDGELENPEELRQTLFIAEDSEETYSKILEWLGSIAKIEINSSKNHEDPAENASYFAKLIKDGNDPNLIVQEMQKRGFLGLHPISCSSREVIFSSYLDFYSLKGMLVNTEQQFFECPRCKGKIPSGQGITKCPHCGVTKEEVGSECD